ncbi:MAG: amidase family protein [Acidobacteriota bacterium]
MSLWRRSGTELAAGVHTGAWRALDVFESCSARADEVEPTIRAFVGRAGERGFDRALEIDRRRAAGQTLGSMAGVPVAIKDNIARAGERLTCGSRLLEDFVSPFSATVVERLIAADAVIFGASNLDTFGMGASTERSVFGPTHNPHDPSRSSGGSSGGSAAAVAAGCVPVALGSDTGGSVRQPAAFCGVWGLRPTWGRVSRWGLTAFASSLDQIGPLARSSNDLAGMMAVIAGADRHDATCVDRSVVEFDGIDRHVEPRVVVVRESLDALPETERGWWHEVCSSLEASGVAIEERSVASWPLAVAAYHIVAASEASSNLARFDGIRFGRRVSRAGFHHTVEASRGDGLGEEVKRRLLLGTFALSADSREAYYMRAQRLRAVLRDELLDALGDATAVLTPTTRGPAFALGAHDEDPVDLWHADSATAPASLAGLPALAIPVGGGADGLPRSVQLIGRRFDEATLLVLGAHLAAAVTPAPRVFSSMDGASEQPNADIAF